MKIDIEFGDAEWQLVLFLLAIGLALTKRVLRNIVKIVTGIWSVFGPHRHSVWRTGMLYLPSINPHTGNMDWAGYRKTQFFVWLRQWAFGEARWKKPAEVSDRGRTLSVADSSSCGDSARRYAAGTVAVGVDDPNAGREPSDDDGDGSEQPDTTTGDETEQ